MSEPLPDDITARIAALLAFERDVAFLPGSAAAKRSRDHARAALEASIRTAIARAKQSQT